jgi:lycopene beta-cyclase
MHSPNKTLWDIVIVGGGLSGLALAAELAAPDFAQLSVLVLDQRSGYTRDRTWSYWRPDVGVIHRYQHLERACWSRWFVGANGQNSTCTSTQHVYATLDADAFYKAAQDLIASAKHVQLRLNTSVAALHKQGAVHHIDLTSHECLNARWVFDARPSAQSTDHSLVQQFEGWEVHTAQDAFDPDTVQLMAFEPHAQGLHFWYVLPYSPRQALIESTWISPATWQPDYVQELMSYVNQRVQEKTYEVVYREQGVLSLAPPADTHFSATALGRGAGTLRPSTGYAFLDSLDHARRLANSLRAALRNQQLAQWQPTAFVRPARQAWLDAVFLAALRRDWLLAPAYFLRLFERVPSDTLLAFLTGHASLAQQMAVMWALPVAPFAGAALRQFWTQGRYA